MEEVRAAGPGVPNRTLHSQGVCSAGGFREFVYRVSDYAKSGMYRLKKALSLRCQGHLMTVSAKQLCPESFLNIFDLYADRAVGHAELSGRVLEIQMARSNVEDAQGVQP